MPEQILMPALVGGIATAVVLLLAIKMKKPVKCEVCGAEQPKFRKPENFQQAMMGGITCQTCGTELTGLGKKRVR